MATLVPAIRRDAVERIGAVLGRLKQDAETTGADLLASLIEAAITEASRQTNLRRTTPTVGLIDCLPDAVAIVDDLGRMMQVNKQFTSLFAFEAGELIGRPIEILMPKRARHRHVDYRTTYQEQPHHRPNADGLALFGKRKDGTEFPIDIGLNPYVARKGFVVVVVRDITARRELEDNERREKDTLTAVVESSPVAIICLAPDRRVLIWNHAAEQVFGYTAKETVGQHYKLTPVDKEDRESTLFLRALAGDSPRSIEVQGQRKDGSLVEISFSCAPVHERNGAVRGVAYALHDISGRKKGEAELVRLAGTDPLTGLLNRRAFFEQLEFALAQSRRSGLACAVIVFDIDDFKEINDLFGHKAGDDVLIAIAESVRKQLRQTDIFARIGGDEFAILASNLMSANAAIDIAEKVTAAVRVIKGSVDARIEASISVGISVFPMDESEADVLLSHADMAMYRSKTSRKGTVNFFDARMDESVKAQHLMKRNMPGDISSGRFYLVFQPIVDAATRCIVGAEGLARWRDVDEKIIAPAQFIPIAEESSLIISLSDHLLEAACGHLRRWRDDTNNRSVPISLNVSAIQLRDPGFGLSFVAKMAQFEIDPRSINVEITESTIIKNLAVATKSLELLRKCGVGLQIDDFGTGYSSLSILKDLPFDALKIDRRFIRGVGLEPRANSIVQAIVELSKKLGFRTIAEGVETEEQASILRDVGVDCLQGYHVSRPVEPVEFARWLKGTELQAAPAA